MRGRRVRGAAVGGALILVVSASSASSATVGTAADLVPGRPEVCGSSAETRGTTGMRHATMMVRSEADYLAEMLPHHEEAVRAARELERSARPSMRALGASIVTHQMAEIAEMRAWLVRWYPDVVPAAGYRPMMRDLGSLDGDALDVAFLDDMIPHHAMAVMMSQQLLRRNLATHGRVAEFAAQVRDDQRAEIRTMRTLLREISPAVPGGAMPRHRLHGPMHG